MKDLFVAADFDTSDLDDEAKTACHAGLMAWWDGTSYSILSIESRSKPQPHGVRFDLDLNRCIACPCANHTAGHKVCPHMLRGNEVLRRRSARIAAAAAKAKAAASEAAIARFETVLEKQDALEEKLMNASLTRSNSFSPMDAIKAL